MDSDDPEKLPELKLDAKQAQGFIGFFRRLPANPQVIRFFDRKDYYTAHGDEAVLIANEYYKTLSALRRLGSGSDSLQGISISRSMLETIVRDLLLERIDHTVELYEGSGSNWKLVKSGTPGKLGSFEDILFANNEMQDSPVVMSVCATIQENERSIGMAYLDTTRRTVGMAEFVDDDQFTNLESAIVGLGCRECLVLQDSSNYLSGKKLEDLMMRCDVLLTERKRNLFKAKDLEQDLGRLVKGPVEQRRDIADQSVAARTALAALISYTELLSDDSSHGKYTFQQYSLNTYMRLDAAALRALNVYESKTDANKYFSLFGLMNRTCTLGMGKRLLRNWLKQPLVDLDGIESRLDTVQAFVEANDLRTDLRQHLKRIPDIDRLARKVERRKANLQDIVKLYQASVRLPFIKDALANYEGEFGPHLQKRYIDSLEEWTGVDHLAKYDGLVEAAVDLEQLEQGEYMIAPGYDNSLQDLKAGRDKVESQIQTVHKQAADDLDISAEKTLKLDKTTQWGYVFRITKKEELKVRKKINSQYVTLETRKDGIKFTSTKLRRLSEQYTKLTEEYTSRQRELVNKVVEVAATFVEVFEGVASMLADMDVLLSFADLAVSSSTPYTRPSITAGTEGEIVLKGSRHPCVEAQEDVNFIPNDCCLVRGQSWFQIITGPNMGGKSTFIRQVGVNVLMAQVGCFVPCESAAISIRDSVFARVGAGDCQLRGVSTFMAEMLETAAILRTATDKSLIIIDELGRGTSTYDGYGLARAICEYIVTAIGAPTLFATHFHELTALADPSDPYLSQPSGVANYHVTAEIDEKSGKLVMLYKVEEGACDRSFGIHVAEFAHFPEAVLEVARAKAAELENFSQLPPVDAKEEVAGTKRKRVCSPDEVATGSQRARKFLQDFAALPLGSMNPKDAVEAVEKLKMALDEDAKENTWLQQFL